MQELLLAVARGLVEDKEAVQVTVDPVRDDGTTVYHCVLAQHLTIFGDGEVAWLQRFTRSVNLLR